MGGFLDDVAKDLASGLPRRQVLIRWAGGLVALLPLGDAAARKHEHFARFLDECREWCMARFGGDTPEARSCAKKAKKGKGPCYSSRTRGPGFVCTKGDPCPASKHCCPTVDGGPSTRTCCARGQQCVKLNATGFCT